MINADMRRYNYYTYSEPNSYGQPTLSTDIKGSIKMVINIASQSVQDNINYLNCSYVGLTQDKAINDTYVIEYGEEKLKVLYVNSKGKLKQVYLQKI